MIRANIVKAAASGALAVCIMAFTVLPLPRLDSWLFNNDPINNLRLGLPAVLLDNGFMKAFQIAAEDNCRKAIPDARQASLCAKYQSNLSISVNFNYPLSIPFAYRLLERYPMADLSGETLKAVRGFTLLGVFLSLIGAAAILWRNLSPPQLFAVASVFSGVTTIAYFTTLHPEWFVPDVLLAIGRHQPLWYFAVFLAASGGAVALLYRLYRSWGSSLIFPALLAAIAVVPVLALLRAAGWVVPAAAIAGLATYLVLIMIAARQLRLGWVEATIIAFFYYAFLNAQHFHLTLFYSREQLVLFFAAVMAALAFRPDSRVVWLLPLCFIFHVSLTAVLALCLFAAEAVLAILTRRSTRMLQVTFLMSVAGLAFNVLSSRSGDISDVRSIDFGALLDMVLHAPSLFPGLAWAIACFAAALFLLFKTSPRFMPLARFGILYSGLCVLTALAAAVRSGGEENYYLGALYVFYYIDQYVGPAVCVAGCGVLLVSIIPGDDAAAIKAGMERGLTWRFGSGVLAIVFASFALAAVKAPPLSTYRSEWVQQAWHGVRLAVGMDEPRRWRSRLDEAAMEDDLYFLSTTNPKNDPVLYFSLLKATLRAETGRLNMTDVRIQTVK